jgi:hydrogenase expression/formation protein HypC
MSEDEAKLSLDAWEELFDVLDEMDGVKKENSE